MKKLPEFVFISSPEFKGYELILDTRSPYLVFRVYKFEDEFTKKVFIDTFPKGHYNKVESMYYNIVLVLEQSLLKGCDLENYLFSGCVFLAWAFYEENRIKGNETRMKKFLKVNG